MSGTQEWVKDNFLIKGVIEILSSVLKLGGLDSNEDRIGNSTCIGGFLVCEITDYIAERCGAIVLSVGMGTPRPKNEIKQDTFLTPFFMSNFKVSMEDEKHLIAICK